MRILLISSRYFPHRGGLESVVAYLAQEFRCSGHTVRIVTNRYPRSLQKYQEIDGVSVFRFHFMLPDKKYLEQGRMDLWLAGVWFKRQTRWQLSHLISKFQPDVINNHYLNEVADITRNCLQDLKPKIPWVVSLHGGDVDGEPKLSAANRERFFNVAKSADGLTVCSQFLAEQAVDLEPSIQSKLTVIHNGVNNNRFSNAVPYTSARPYILAVGQLSRHKGFDLLIRAFAAVTNEYPAVQLRIAGEGDQHASLQALISELNLADQVLLMGKLDEHQVAPLMAGCLFLAMPSLREPFGIVALEGMAAGKLVLATPVGGLPEFVPVPPNFLIKPDVSEWTKAIEQCLQLVLSGEWNGRVNQAAARQHDWSFVAQNYLQIYQQAIIHV